ncbi:MAG: PorT family protein [Prevotella sp.]|nr:PorT family protein [Prevotella sp.]
MKRLMFTIASIIMTLPMLAQYDAYGRTQASMPGYADERNIYYGLRLGMGISTVNSDDSDLDGGSSQTGLNLGAVAGFQLSPSAPVYLETGLFYTEKGGKGYVDNSKFTYDLNYLEIPIIVKYRYSIDDSFSVQPFAGGYIAFGVGGKVKNYSERETSSSFSENYFKRFDGGLKIGCGAEYQMIYAELAYDWGLANICHSDFDTSRTGCFYINCGVNF